MIFRFLENHFSKGMITTEVLTYIMGDRLCRGLEVDMSLQAMVVDGKDLDRALIWGGWWTQAVQHIPGILQHTWHPQAARAVFTISPQACVVCWALKNTEKRHSRIQFILVPVLSSFEAMLSLWYEYVVALLLFVCMALAAVPSCLPVDSAQLAGTLAVYKWVHETLSHHGTLLEEAAGFTKSRAFGVKMWHAWLSLSASFPFIDVQNAYCPEATLRQSLLQYFFYSNILHSFFCSLSRFNNNKCFWKTDICQMEVSSKGLLYFHRFILLG